MGRLAKSTGYCAFPILSAAALLCVGGCASETKPSGQVVATVDGTDITQRDMQSELLANGLQTAPQTKQLRSEVLEKIINRKLIDLEAQKAGVDNSPDYLAAIQRAREVILAQMFVTQRVQQYPEPSPADVQQFVADNPQMFSERKVYTLDQISLMGDTTVLKHLQELSSMEEIVKWLKLRKVPYSRRQAKVDSSSIAKDLVIKMNAIANGIPFITQQSANLLVSSKLDVASAPLGKDLQQDAAAILKRQNVEKAIEDQISYRRRAAKITYKSGYAPDRNVLSDVDKK